MFNLLALKVYVSAIKTFIRNVRNRKFEPEVPFLQYILGAGNVVMHIGASDARHSYIMSKLVGDDGKIYALEPSSYSFKHLQLMTRLHALKNVSCFKIAASDDVGEIILVTPKKSTGHAGRSFAFTVDNAQALTKRSDIKSSESLTETVDSITIDEFVERNYIKAVDFIRCDTEGSEMKILNGAVNTIDLYKPSFLIEIHNDILREIFDSNPEEVVDFFIKKGYKMFKEESGKILSVKEVDDVKWKDYFFIHKQKLEQLKNSPFYIN